MCEKQLLIRRQESRPLQVRRVTREAQTSLDEGLKDCKISSPQIRARSANEKVNLKSKLKQANS